MAKDRVPVLAANKTLSTGLPKTEDGWHVFTQVNNFIQGLELDALNTDKGDAYQVLTAVPSPWVRAYMMTNSMRWPYITRHAKQEAQNTGKKLPGMEGLYGAMQDEYKGLLACLALYSSRVTIEKVTLDFKDEKVNKELDSQIDILKKVYNIYDVAGAFGNMLFEDAPLWSDSRKSKEEYNPPYVQLLHMDGVVIGATGPGCLIYPAASYDLSRNGIGFFKKGRFRDPIDFFDAKQLEKLYHYCGRLREQINDYENTLTNPLSILLSVRTFLGEFMQEIKEHITTNYKGHEIKPTGVLDYFQKFSFPFDLVFNMDMKIYKTKDGRYLNNNETGNLEEFNPDLLLLNSETSNVIMLDPEVGFNPELSTVLKAIDENKKAYYFALPLSVQGLNEFYNEISDLLTEGKGDKSLTATYDPEENSLDVCLELEISNSMTPFFKRYKIANQNEPFATSVILWPNFVSPKWNEYYMYSEAPHNRKGFKSLPLYANKDSVTGVRQNENGDIYHVTEDTRKTYERDFKTELIVRYDEQLLKERSMNYEIYKSEVPFTGIEIRTSTDALTDSCCGFVLMRNNTQDKNQSVINFTSNRDELDPVYVGIDFGSTNTTITQSNLKGGHNNIIITNRRRFILGKENTDNNVYALPNELFFFQNDRILRSVKSAMVYHDLLRIVNPELGVAHPISGGVPVFERNINLLTGKDNIMLFNAIPNEETELLYDLKWKREDRYLVNKKAYIKAIWLYLNAELFAEKKRPSTLLWSYPTSMPRDLRKTYEGIYQEVIDTINPIQFDGKTTISPLSDDQRITMRALSESEAVCNYALSGGGVGLGATSVMVGIDIGGVTSDILVLTTDPGNKRAKLMKQSSVKIAANKLANAIGSSENLQKCIKHFVRMNKLELPSLENINDTTANYLTNLLFEEMEDNEKLERSFYRELWSPENEQLSRNETRGLIAIASYICGLLLFHSGQVIKSMLDDPENATNPSVSELKNGFHLKISPFGKGGKLFDWLNAALNEFSAEEFYKKCFSLGFNVGVEDAVATEPFKSFSIIVQRDNLKMEVGYGLTSPRDVLDVDPRARVEIVGESGYVFKDAEGNKKVLNWNDPINPSQIFEFGEDLIIPEPANNNSGLAHFEKYKTAYLDLVKNWDIFDYSVIASSSQNFAQVSLENYVKKDEDWIAGANMKNKTGDEEDFMFSCSPFLYQGMCYLDEVIMKTIYKK